MKQTIRVLLCGKTKSGKSSLINAVIGRKVAETSADNSVTLKSSIYKTDFIDYATDKQLLDKIKCDLSLPTIEFIDTHESKFEDVHEMGDVDLIICLTQGDTDQAISKEMTDIKFNIALVDLVNVGKEDQDKYLNQLNSEGVSRQKRLLLDVPFLHINSHPINPKGLKWDKTDANINLKYKLCHLISNKLELAILTTGCENNAKVQVWLEKSSSSYKDFAYSIHTKIGEKSNFVYVADYKSKRYVADKINAKVQSHRIVLFK